MTSIIEDSISLRDDVYDDLLKGKNRARFTATHELSHRILHCNGGLARGGSSEQIKAYEDPEWQADNLAGAILIPREAILEMTSEEVCRIYSVSPDCYRKRRDRVIKYLCKDS